MYEKLRLGFWAKQKSEPIRTSLGLARPLPLDQEVADLMDLETKDRESDLFVGQPGITKKTVNRHNISVIGKELAECNITSPWYEAKREIKDNSAGFEVVDTLTSLRPLITSDEIKSARFARLQNELRDCYQNRYITYKIVKPLNQITRLPSSAPTE